MFNRLILFSVLFLMSGQPYAQDDAQAKTVLGPRNPDLFFGAEALRDGDGDRGVRLTMSGLKSAVGRREEQMGHANLCVGFLLLDQPLTALEHCDWVLERNDRHWRSYNNRALVYLRLDRYEEAQADIAKGQELSPNSEKLKEVKAMYLDKVEPVAESILMDERRKKPNVSVREGD